MDGKSLFMSIMGLVFILRSLLTLKAVFFLNEVMLYSYQKFDVFGILYLHYMVVKDCWSPCDGSQK
jgi:hypothetical protein